MRSSVAALFVVLMCARVQADTPRPGWVLQTDAAGHFERAYCVVGGEVVTSSADKKDALTRSCPLALPAQPLGAEAGARVLAPTPARLHAWAAESEDASLSGPVYALATVVRVGKERSTLRFESGDAEVPNGAVIPLPPAAEASAGDVLLVPYPAGTGLARARVLEAGPQPRVQRLHDGTTGGMETGRMRAGTFAVLPAEPALVPGSPVVVTPGGVTRSIDPGTGAETRERRRYFAVVIRASGDDVQVLQHGRLQVHKRSQVTPIPTRVESLPSGRRVLANLGTPEMVEAVVISGPENGHYTLQVDGREPDSLGVGGFLPRPISETGGVSP